MREPDSWKNRAIVSKQTSSCMKECGRYIQETKLIIILENLVIAFDNLGLYPNNQVAT
jgi:hypothetical protein